MGQNAAASDQHYRNVASGGLHAIDTLFEHRAHALNCRGDDLRVERLHSRRITDVGHTRGHGDVGCRQCPSAEHEPLLQKAEAHGFGSDAHVCALDAHDTATAETHRKHVRHSEVRAHAADVDGDGALARKAIDEHTHVGGGAADVDDHAAVDSAQETAAANTVRRAGGKRQHGKLAGALGRHQRAVVLAHIERAGDTERHERSRERVHDLHRHAGE